MGVGSNIVAMVGGPDSPFREAVRRRLDADDIRYARQCRAKGWGWQAIAQQLRVNELDLRQACEQVEQVSDAREALPTPAGQGDPMVFCRVKPGTPAALALLAIDAGARDRHMVAKRINRAAAQAGGVLDRLRARGFVTRSLRLTAEGKAEVEAQRTQAWMAAHGR
jgi:hypothetical protein